MLCERCQVTITERRDALCRDCWADERGHDDMIEAGRGDELLELLLEGVPLLLFAGLAGTSLIVDALVARVPVTISCNIEQGGDMKRIKEYETRKLRKFRKATAVALPEHFLKECGWEEGDRVELELNPDEATITIRFHDFE